MVFFDAITEFKPKPDLALVGILAWAVTINEVHKLRLLMHMKYSRMSELDQVCSIARSAAFFIQTFTPW